MSEYKYTYDINEFPNNTYNTSKLDKEIRDSNIVVSLAYISGAEEYCDIYFRAILGEADWTTLSGIVSNHDGEPLLESQVTDVNIVSSSASAEIKTDMSEIPKDRSGKLRVHQTSRKLGTKIMWTGIGDDVSDINKVGGGETLTFIHTSGDPSPLVKYIDFNIIENETYIHEGYMTWSQAKLDTLTLQIVPRVVTVSGVVGGNKTVYGGYLVVPTAPGAGNYEVTSDLTLPHGGLVYMPNGGDLNDAPTAYWDADWNSSTKKFENIRPNYTGSGRYNIFSYEVIFAEFVRQIPFLDSGFIPLNSSDTEALGHGMRMKMTACTNIALGDHDWSLACILCLHREQSV